ncbi:hypothetical protein X797_007278 [Metarhizium robertsii]|uniref:Uncharacterized protein n=1 Tax=Metarhizium robertsii TaxID=568076 RepID=A0A014NCT1_9HYPO|nr:hypothetical protein X797_007278 [Metarhizium robertsii]
MPMHRLTTTNLWLNIASSRRDGVATRGSQGFATLGPDFSPQEWFYFNGKYRRHSSLQQYRGRSTGMVFHQPTRGWLPAKVQNSP